MGCSSIGPMLRGRSNWPRIAGCLFATAAFMALAASALAQQDGVHFDPETPAGKEYAVPTESARNTGVPPSSTSRNVGGGAPAFGAGISRGSDAPQSTETSGGAAGRDGTADSGRGRSNADETRRGSPESRSFRPTAAALASTDGGPSGGLVTALIALGVLVVGGLGALALRKLRSAP
jgi:hypothetical protein